MTPIRKIRIPDLHSAFRYLKSHHRRSRNSTKWGSKKVNVSPKLARHRLRGVHVEVVARAVLIHSQRRETRVQRIIPLPVLRSRPVRDLGLVQRPSVKVGGRGITGVGVGAQKEGVGARLVGEELAGRVDHVLGDGAKEWWWGIDL